jgi:hypothetical protein
LEAAAVNYTLVHVDDVLLRQLSAVEQREHILDPAGSMHGTDIPAVVAVQDLLQPVVEQAYGKPLQRYRCQLRAYEPGDELPEHVDGYPRTVSMTLTVAGEYPDGYEGWPLCIDVDGIVERIPLLPGDGVIYSGNRHWRERWEIEDGFQLQALFFWADPSIDRRGRVT